MYVAYNVQIIQDPASYGTNFLYKKADAVFFVGAALYLAAALRDCGVFFFLPFVPGCAFDFGAEAKALAPLVLRQREAAPGEARVQDLIARAGALGYDTAMLRRTQQP